jgi:Coenzyme PQQ synthesis protein D (PqqD)
MSTDLQVTAAPLLYRIRPGVARVRRAHSVVLVSPERGRSVRVSSTADDLVPLLVAGASFADMAQRLRERHPRAADVEAKLRQFLGQLEEAGLLGTRVPPRRPRVTARFALVNPDPFARWLAERLLRWPRGLAWSLLAAASVAALAALAVLVVSGRLPHPSALFTQFSLYGLALFVLVVLVHEAAHALACRLSGAEVGEAGLILHGWLMPGPYVDTSHMYRVASRWPRFWVAAAGPLVDALGAGAAAAWLLTLDGSLPAQAEQVQAATTLLLLCTVFVFLDTNPLMPSDGSRMLEALLGDELARRSALTGSRARMSSMKTVALYRIACSMHLQAGAAIAVAWWIWTH